MKLTNKFFSISAFILLQFGWINFSGCNNTTQNNLQPLNIGSAVPPPQAMTLVISNYAPTPGNLFKNIFVSNFSIKVGKGQALPVASRDGLPDSLKTSLNATYGFVPTGGPYSTGFPFSDLFFYLAGINSTQQNFLNCPGNQMNSSSSDAFVYLDDRTNTTQFIGLRDCEKLYSGLSPSLFDNSGSGVPDYLKLRCGLNPQNKFDTALSAAADSVSSLDKCKENIPIDESASTPFNSMYAYDYNTTTNSNGSKTFTISNLVLLNAGVENFIAIYLVETNIVSHASVLYTAFLIPKSALAGQTFNIPYWAPHPAPSPTPTAYPYGMNVEITTQ